MPKTLEGSGPLSLFRMRKGLTFKAELGHFPKSSTFLEQLEENHGGTGTVKPKTWDRSGTLSLLEKVFDSLQGRNWNCSTQNPGGIWNPFPF